MSDKNTQKVEKKENWLKRTVTKGVRFVRRHAAWFAGGLGAIGGAAGMYGVMKLTNNSTPDVSSIDTIDTTDEE